MSTNNTPKGEIYIALGLLAISLGILGVGSTLPKNNTEGITLCNAKEGNRGYFNGVITSVTKEENKININLTEGSQGCKILLIANYNMIGKLTVGNRIKFLAVVETEGILKLASNNIEKDPTVMDTGSNTESPESIKVKISELPEFKGSSEYTELSINLGTGIPLDLKIDEKKVKEIILNQPIQIYYYPSTKVINQIKRI